MNTYKVFKTLQKVELQLITNSVIIPKSAFLKALKRVSVFLDTLFCISVSFYPYTFVI